MINRKPLRVLFFIIVLYMIISLTKSIVGLLNRETIVVDAENRLNQLRLKHRQLKQRLKEVNDPFFIEKESRDKLGMGKTGEQSVIMPSISVPPEVSPTGYLNNRDRWINLFLDRE